jgi:starvation-inducible DNA-binding protein
MYPTRNDLPETTRAKVAQLLATRLCDAIDLVGQVKQAHWSVKGPCFIGLHELFDRIAESIDEYVDLLAERAVMLGGTVEGTARSVAKSSTLPEYPLRASSGREHCEAVAGALATFGGNIRRAIDEAADMQDSDTVDLFTEVSRGVDKWLWFVEAHLQAND